MTREREREHPIAKYLSEEQKARACRYYYRNKGRTDDGYCPLGVALDTAEAAPLTRKAAAELLRTNPVADYGELFTAVASFMLAWDAGQIPSLSEAFGYHPVPAVPRLMDNILLGNTVYLLTAYYPYEGEDPVGIFTTKERATGFLYRRAPMVEWWAEAMHEPPEEQMQEYSHPRHGDYRLRALVLDAEDAADAEDADAAE